MEFSSINYPLSIKTLTKYPNLITEKNFYKACKKGLLQVIKWLIKKDKISASINNSYGLLLAVEYGHDKVVKYLLSLKCIDPSTNDNLAIVTASQKGFHKIVKLLLTKQCVDPTSHNNTSILLACSNGHFKVIKLLLKDLRFDNKALTEARHGLPQVGEGLALRARDRDGTSLIYNTLFDGLINLSFKNGHFKIMKLLNNYVKG